MDNSKKLEVIVRALELKANSTAILDINKKAADIESKILNSVGRLDYTPDATKHGEIFNDYVNNQATGAQSHAEGWHTTASGENSHTEGCLTIASKVNSHAEGRSTEANGAYSHAEGNGCQAVGNSSHAEGLSTTTWGHYSHTEGKNTIADGPASHAEGVETDTYAKGSHAEGISSYAAAEASHAEGYSTNTQGLYSHSEGNNTGSEGNSSHAEGWDTYTTGEASHTEGKGTVAENFAQHSQGLYNMKEATPSATAFDATKTLFSIGNGAYSEDAQGLETDEKRSDALKMLGNGTIWIAGIGDFTGRNPTDLNSLLAIITNLLKQITDLQAKIK